jgi:hypothetical protein
MLEDNKAEVALEFFKGIMAKPPIRTRRVKLEQLDLRHADLSSLCGRFFEQEVWSVIKSLPPDKVPGPDGFSARFLQAAWPIIHHDLMLAFDSFWRLDSRNLHSVNDAMLTLLPKTAKASKVTDYHPISLIHIVGKLLSKVLVNRLTPRLGNLVHIN